MSDDQKKVPRVVRLKMSPELVWATRAALADVMREVAESEADPRVARRLTEIATRFEIGIGSLAEWQTLNRPADGSDQHE